MRKITQQAIEAFYHPDKLGMVFNKGNTWVTHSVGLTQLYLHGSCIAKRENGITSINPHGYTTTTTKERLNGLHGVHITQRSFIWYLNGGPMATNDWTVIG